MAHRLMGEWQPTAEFWRQLVAPDTRDADISRPYPFCLAYPAGRRRRGPRRPCRLADRMEMGWHSRAVDPPPVADLSLVARRRTDHGPLPRTGGAGRATARRHRHRWRSAALEGWRAAALRADAAPHRPQGAGPEDSRRKFRWSWWPTTCWNSTARTSASVRWNGGAPACRPSLRPLPRWCSRPPCTSPPGMRCGNCARNRARARSKASCSSGSARPTASAAAAAIGGSGRSIPTRWIAF